MMNILLFYDTAISHSTIYIGIMTKNIVVHLCTGVSLQPQLNSIQFFIYTMSLTDILYGKVMKIVKHGEILSHKEMKFMSKLWPKWSFLVGHCRGQVNGSLKNSAKLDVHTSHYNIQYTTFTPVQLQNQMAKLNIAAAKSSLIIQKVAFILFLINELTRNEIASLTYILGVLDAEMCRAKYK